MTVINDKYLLKASSTITVSEDEKEVSLELTENILQSGGTVTGTVYDTTILVGPKIAGATVKIFDTDGHPLMHTETGPNGQYTFSNVPAGSYLISAIKDGFIMAIDLPIIVTTIVPVVQSIVLLRDLNNNQGVVYGTVKDSETSLALKDVEVLISKETEGTFNKIAATRTIDDGEYVIEDLDPDTYTILFSKNGFFSSEPITVTVIAGTNTLESIQLAPNPDANTGTINGIIKNTLGVPITNAFVGLYSVVEGVPETLIATTYTNLSGKYIFGGVVDGEYIVKAKLSELI